LQYCWNTRRSCFQKLLRILNRPSQHYKLERKTLLFALVMASFDADEGPTELRLRGNASYKASEFETAIELYSQAVALHEHEHEKAQAQTQTLGRDGGSAPYPADAYLSIGNRSACHLALSQWEAAAADARLAWEHCPTNDKYCFRLVTALRALAAEDAEQLGAAEEAEAALAAGLQKIPASAALHKLKAQTTDAGAGPPTKGKGKGKGKGEGKSPIDKFYAAEQALFCRPCDPPPSSRGRHEEAPAQGALLVETAAQAAYSDDEYALLLHAKAFVKSIQLGRGRSAAQQHILSGRLQQMCSGPEAFYELLFPGSSPDARKAFPQNLQELLLWPELILDLTAVARAAAKVLAGVKARGALAGDVMDQATKDMLSPQIAQEALAREILAAVRKINKDYSRVAASTQLAVASETAPQALLDQLDSDVVAALHATGFAAQEEYLGPQWAALLGADLQNFAKYEHMSDVEEPGMEALLAAGGAGGGAGARAASGDTTLVPVRLAWLDRAYEQYPALTEAMSKLLALPYELNKKLSEAESTAAAQLPKLLEPASKIALMHYRPLSRQSPRVDCRPGRGDSGIRLTCAYHLVPSLAKAVGSVQWERGPAAVEAAGLREGRGREDVADDLLLLHHSTTVQTARPAAASEYFVLCFYVHGKTE